MTKEPLVNAVNTRKPKRILISLSPDLDRIVLISQVKPNKAKWFHSRRETVSTFVNLKHKRCDLSQKVSPRCAETKQKIKKHPENDSIFLFFFFMQR